jgi:beta-N-acetylhexosaminidase
VSVARTEIERLAGRVIVAGFDGVSSPEDVLGELSDGALGGVILFKRNVEDPDQVAALLDECRRSAPDEQPPLALVDQEGGRVIRIREPLAVLPPARRFGELDDPDLTSEAGRLVGRELCSLGFTVDCAPVLDVDTNPDSPVIGDRSYGGTPAEVVRHGLAFGRGLREGGVHPCAKHFPGHGDAALDSHRSLPRVEHGRDRLEAVEMEPFRAWARTGLGPVMTAHVVYPALDPEGPATASAEIIKELLKGRLACRAPVLSDDMEMGAIAEIGGAAALAVRAIEAGVDGLLVCRLADARLAVREALTREAREHPAFQRKLERAAARLSTLAHPPGKSPGPSWIGSDEHRRARQALLGKLGAERA